MMCGRLVFYQMDPNAASAVAQRSHHGALAHQRKWILDPRPAESTRRRARNERAPWSSSHQGGPDDGTTTRTYRREDPGRLVAGREWCDRGGSLTADGHR